MASSASEHIDKDMNFNAINRLRLENLVETEGIEAPWSIYSTNPNLMFPPGLVWYSNAAETIRFSYEAYEADPTPGPAIHNVARSLVIPISGASPITVGHNLHNFVVAQFFDSVALSQLTPTTFVQETLEHFTVTFTGTWSAIAVVVG